MQASSVHGIKSYKAGVVFEGCRNHCNIIYNRKTIY